MSSKKKSKSIAMDSKPKEKSGPKPDVLKIEGDWKENIKKSLTKKKPPEGWPK
jgi:hypothetical protein